MQSLHAMLVWQQAMGVDDAVSDAPAPLIVPKIDPETALREAQQRLEQTATLTPTAAAAPATAPSQAGPSASEAEAIATAHALASACADFASLQQAVAGFEGCALRRTAQNTVFTDGNPAARVLCIGEAPGEEEDRQGTPFCGRSGQLLTRMLAAIGLDRTTDTLITNSLFWRPPGNRSPSSTELALCRPFVMQLLEITQPDLVLLFGGVAAKSILNQETAVSRLRGSTHTITLASGKTLAARVTYHPSYLLRTPAQKAAAWADLLGAQALLQTEK